MRYEKSCGAVIWKRFDAEDKYLLILNKKAGGTGHWGFPNGHREGDENEFETASREIFEETGLLVVFQGGKRAVSTYSPKSGVTKDAVYFLAAARDGEIKLQNTEVADYKWCNFSEAMNLLTHDKENLKKLVN